jgi:hypothetical protein
MVEEGAPRRGQFDAMDTARQQGNADFVFEIADLAAERRLRRVQSLLGGDGETAFLRDRDEVSKVPQLHIPLHT